MKKQARSRGGKFFEKETYIVYIYYFFWLQPSLYYSKFFIYYTLICVYVDCECARCSVFFIGIFFFELEFFCVTLSHSLNTARLTLEFGEGAVELFF